MIEDHELGARCSDGISDFLRFAGTDEQARIGITPRAADRRDDLGTGRTRPFDEFLAIRLEVGTGKFEMDEQRPLARLRTFKHASAREDAGTAGVDQEDDESEAPYSPATPPASASQMR